MKFILNNLGYFMKAQKIGSRQDGPYIYPDLILL